MAANAIVHRGRRVLLKHHKFNDGRRRHPPNGLGALEDVLGAGTEVIEFDVSLLGDGTFALLHDERLEAETDGTGPVVSLNRAGLKRLRLRGSDEPPATLDEVAARLRTHTAPAKVQVDLKEARPLGEARAAALLEGLAPLRENEHVRVVVGCLADWNLRMLRRLDPSLALGFDPAFYLRGAGSALELPFPTRVNAYGYVDDHPLGHHRVMRVSAYLQDRMEVLAAQLPGLAEAYLHKGFVTQALEDGFDPIAFLREERGVFVDVWTLNAGDRDFDADLKRVLDAQPDQLTTDTAEALVERAAALAPGGKGS